MIGSDLDTLEAKGLIRLAASRPELEYLFRHWLVQDAAYGSLLKQERRQLHRLVGDALEDIYPERRGELAGVLALHFEQAGETDRAVGYLIAAGSYALERNAITEAFAAYDRAQGLLPSPTATESEALRRRRVDIALGRARAGYSFRPLGEQVADLEAAVPAAEALGDLDLLASLHMNLAMTRLQSGEPATDPVVRRSLERVTHIGEQLQDPSLRALPLAMIGLNQVFIGPVAEGVAALSEAVPLLEARQDQIGAAFARGALGVGHARLGNFKEAEAAARNAIELAAGGDVIAQLDAQIMASMVWSIRGELDQAAPIAEACVLRAEETGAAACVVASAWVLGDVYQRQGRFQDASRTLGRGTELAMVVDRKVWRPTLQAWLKTNSIALGGDTAEGDWDELLETARSVGNRYGEAGILAKRGEAHAQRGQHDAACSDFTASAAILEEFGARPDLARVLHGWGLAIRAAGRAEQAEATLRRSLALFEELGLTGEAEIVRASLGT